jgi:hypothetical protein
MVADGEFRHRSGVGIDPADLVAVDLRQPQIPVRTRDDVEGSAAGGGNGELRDCMIWRCRDAPDLVGAGLGEPQIVVRSERDPMRNRATARDCKLIGQRAGSRDAADVVAADFGEPHGTV